MANFRTIHTLYGLQRMVQAEATGIPINLTQMAVGDGNDKPVSLDPKQTQLAREKYRSTVNRVYPDTKDPIVLIGELAIPPSVGGFTLREIGIFDDAGGLFAVGMLPETYKPETKDGAFSDTFVRMRFAVTNADVVTLLVDPNVAVASQAWIINTITPGYLLPGGLTGQVARKRSNKDGDIEWGDPTETNVVVTTIEEEQTLVESQTLVELVKTNTVGLALYIEGRRLPLIDDPDGWQPHASDVTKAILGKAYPAGTKLIAVQNEPASHLEKSLQQDQNLADLENKATARTNLDVYSKAETDLHSKSAGDIFYTAGSTAPAGSMKANGAAVSRTAYARLFGVIGTTYGAGDGFNTFNIPDLRGEFIRGLDEGRGIDPNRILGSNQAGQNAAHTHGVTDPGHTHEGGNLVGAITYTGSGGSYLEEGQAAPNYIRDTMRTAVTGIAIQSSGGSEARPRNIAMLACIVF